MKTTLLALAITATALLGFTNTAEAGTKKDIIKFIGKQIGNPRHGHPGCGAPAPYVIRTVEISRYSQPRHGFRPCGSRYTYYVTVATYRDLYSNGGSRTYTRTFS